MFPNLLFSPVQPVPIPSHQGLSVEEERSILQTVASTSSTPPATRARLEPPTQRRRHALHGNSGSGYPKDPPPHSPEGRPEAQRAMFHPVPFSPAAAMAAAAAASSAVRNVTMSHASTSQPSSSAPPLYPTHFVPRPMFQGLPLSSVPSTAAPSGVNGLNLLGEALALRGGLTFNGFSSPSSTAISASTAATVSKSSPASSSKISSSTSSSSASSSQSTKNQTLPSLPLNGQASSLTTPLAGPPTMPHPALLLPGRPYPTLDEEQLRYLSLAQIQAANQAHLAGEVAKLKQQSPHFLTRNYLELAMLVCNTFRGKLFPCPHCRYVTDRRNNLKRHVATMHQTCDKQLECCGVRFSTKASLREHITIFHHNGYSCPFCGRRFCRKALLKRHLSVHSGQKDYTCPSCDYATSHKSNLERHKRIHARLHLMGGDASGHDIDDEELRRMEEEEEEEDRRRRRQTASMMMMLDEDDDETQDVDIEGQRGPSSEHNAGAASPHGPTEGFRTHTHPWPIPGLMGPGGLSFLSPYPTHFANRSSQETNKTMTSPLTLDERDNSKCPELHPLYGIPTNENITATKDETPGSKAHQDVEEEVDVEIDVNDDDDDAECANENGKDCRREEGESLSKQEVTKPDCAQETDNSNPSNNNSNHNNNNNNNNNNSNDKNVKPSPPLYRPFSTIFSPADHVRDNQPINLIVDNKHGPSSTVADITMATRLAHGFAAIPSFQPRF